MYFFHLWTVTDNSFWTVTSHWDRHHWFMTNNEPTYLSLWPFEEAKSLDSYQHRTLGTSRRHGVHHHTTPFHSTASEATLSLPRRAVLALWGSTSKTHFVILLFVILLKIRIFSQNLEITESHIIILYYIIYYNILYNIIFINNIPSRSCTIIYSPKSLNFNKITK